MELAGQQNKINKHGYIAIDKLLKGHDVQSEAASLSKGKRRQWIGKDCLIKILSDKTLRGNPQRSALVLLLNQVTPKSVKNSVTQSECSVKTTGVGHKMEGMCRGSNASAHESANVNTDAANLSSTCDAKPKTQATSFTQNRFILGQNVAIKIVGSALYFSFRESMLLAGQLSKVDKHGYSRIDKIFKSLAIAPEEAFLMKGRRRQWIEKKSYIRFLTEPRVKPNHVDPALIILINRITIATMRPKGQSQSDVSQELAADAPNSRDTTINVSADTVSVDSTDVPEPVNHSVTSMDSMDSVQSTVESGDPAYLVSKAGVDSSQSPSADTVSVDSTDVPEPVNHSVTSMDSMDSVQSTVESGDPAYLVSKAGVDSSQLCSADTVSVDSTDVPEPVNHSVTSMDSMDSVQSTVESGDPAYLVSKAGVDSSQLCSADTVSVDSTDVPEPVNHSVTSMDSMDSVQSTVESGDPAYLVSKAGVDSSQLCSADTVSVDSTDVPEPVNHSVTSMDSMDSVQSTVESGDPAYLVSKAGVDSSQLCSADTVSVDSTDVPEPVNHSVTSMDSMDSVQSTVESGDPAYLVSKAGVDSSQLCSADTVSVDFTDVPEPVNHSVTSMDSMDSVQSTVESGDPAYLVSKAGVDSSQPPSADTVSVDSTDVPEPVDHSVTSMDSMDSVQSTVESGDPAYLVSKAGVDSSQLCSADTVSVDSTDVPEPVNHSVTSMDSMDSVQSTVESGDPAYLVSKAGVDSSQPPSADTVSVDSTDVPEPVDHSVTSMDSMDSVQSTVESGDPAYLVSKAGVDSSQLCSADTVSVDSTDVPEPVNHSVTSMDSMDSTGFCTEGPIPEGVVHLLDKSVPYLWLNGKRYVETEDLFSELEWDASLRKNGDRYILPYLSKKGLTPDSYQKLGNTRYISLISLIRILDWKVGSKPQKARLRDEIPVVLEELAFKNKAKLPDVATKSVQCHVEPMNVQSAQEYLSKNTNPKISLEVATNIYKENHPVTPQDIMYFEQNVSGTRLFDKLRKKFPGLMPPKREVMSLKKMSMAEFEAVLLPRRSATGWYIDPARMMELMHFRYPFLPEQKSVAIYGDGRGVGGRQSTYLAMSVLNHDLMLHSISYHSPKEIFPVHIFYESDNLEENLGTSNFLASYMQKNPDIDFYLSGDEMFLEKMLDGSNVLGPLTEAGWNIYSAWPKEQKQSVGPDGLRTQIVPNFDRNLPDSLVPSVPLDRVMMCGLHAQTRITEKTTKFRDWSNIISSQS